MSRRAHRNVSGVEFPTLREIISRRPERIARQAPQGARNCGVRNRISRALHPR
jgi:hypothetical protein